LKPKLNPENENSYFKNSPFIEKEVLNDENYINNFNNGNLNNLNNFNNDDGSNRKIIKETIIKYTNNENENENQNDINNDNLNNDNNNNLNNLKSSNVNINYTFGFRPNQNQNQNTNQNQTIFTNNPDTQNQNPFLINNSNTNNIILNEQTVFKDNKSDSSEYSISSYEPTLNTKKIYKLICNVLPNTRQVVVYDSASNKIIRKNLNFPPQMGLSQFLNNCAWVNYNNHLYVSGGIYGSNSFIVYTPIKSKFTRHTDSLFSHEEHSLLANGQFVFLIGGDNKKTEKYKIKERKFENFGELKFIQKKPILFIHKNYLYSFFGMNENNEFIDRVQRRNIKNNNGKWEEIAINNKFNVDVKMIGAGIMKINEDVIYFLGGKGKEGLRKTTIEFNFKNMSLNVTPYNLEEKAYFKDSVLMRLNNNTYGNFSLEDGNPFLKITFVKN
jgi:hypothetical protein